MTSRETGRLEQSLERAGRVADFLEMASSCAGACARVPRRTLRESSRRRTARPSGTTKFATSRRDAGEGKTPIRNVEQLEFQNVHLATRSYK